jgi:hypothetical protein
MTFENAAEILVARITDMPRCSRPRYIRLSFLDDSREPTVPYHWRKMNMFGVTFQFAEADKARAWAVAAMQAGYKPHYGLSAGAFFGVAEMSDALKAS